jgi:hypothetical protein
MTMSTIKQKIEKIEEWNYIKLIEGVFSSFCDISS